MSITKFDNYTKKICKDLKDCKVRDYIWNRIQKLGFNRDQTYTLILIQTSKRCIVEQDSVKKLTQYIKENENNLEPEEIYKLAYNLAKTASTIIAQSLHLKLLWKKLCKLDANNITLESIYISDII
jgi:hypothetical protein